MTTQARTPQLGETVIFRDHQGLPKAAMVTCTQETYDQAKAQNGGNQVPRLDGQDELHLSVFSPTGSIEVRHGIRRGHGPGQWQPTSDGYR